MTELTNSIYGSALLLAGGQSQRMGFDKQELVIDGDYLSHRLCRQLQSVFEQVVVVTQRPNWYQGLSVQTTQDHYSGQGPLAGLHAGLTLSRSLYTFVLACDMPIFSLDYLKIMQARLDPNTQILATQGDQGQLYPFHAFYRCDLVPVLEESLQAQDRRLQPFLRRQNLQTIPIEEVPDPTIFVNLNRPEDLQTYLGGSPS